jgi:uncharacterized protein
MSVALGAWLAVAAAFWCLLFAPWIATGIGFWTLMPLAIGVLGLGALATDPGRWAPRLRLRPVHIAIGLAAAVVLYLIFAVGNYASTRLFGFAPGEIASIYARRSEASPWWIALTLLLWIGPGEEIFWRGFVQHRLMQRYGSLRGMLAATAFYAGVHAWAGNAMLLLAALVCGLFWGALYTRTRSLWPGIISHALWDVAVFVLCPLR